MDTSGILDESSSVILNTHYKNPGRRTQVAYEFTGLNV